MAAPLALADADTIVANASAAGSASVGVVRISGMWARVIGEQLSGGKPLLPRRAHYRHIYDRSGASIDAGLLLYFPGPASFTGEDVVEVQAHGNDYILAAICSRAQELGARAAQPGEYSKRAFLNGKLDLAQAEAIADLIASQSRGAALAASKSLQGQFSRLVAELEQSCTALRAWVEASLDFPDEEVEYVDPQYLQQRLLELIQQLAELLERCQSGMRLQQGAQLVLSGAPNVGKSSLMNALLEHKRAIVSAQAGTTRDLVSADWLLDGMRLSLTDSAGLRNVADSVEQEGIGMAQQALRTADMILLVTSAEPEVSGLGHYYDYEQLQRSLVIVNKIDLSGLPPALSSLRLEHESGALTLDCVSVSAKTGAGLDLLRSALALKLRVNPAALDSALSARARHVGHLEAARAQLELARGCPAPELAAEHLRTASEQLQAITGTQASEALLDSIFSQFCLGK